MQILYGVVGEGMGHATRSRVVLELLLAADTPSASSSPAAPTSSCGAASPRGRGITIDEIHGLHLSYEGNALDLGESVRHQPQKAPRPARRTSRSISGSPRTASSRSWW